MLKLNTRVKEIIITLPHIPHTMNTTSTTSASWNSLAPVLTGIAIGTATSFFNMIPWAALIALLPLIGIRVYNITDNDTAKRIQKRVKNPSHLTHDRKALGYAFGSIYGLFINVTQGDFGDRYNVRMFATEASFKKLTEETEVVSKKVEEGAPEPVKKKSITIFDRNGTYFNAYYNKRTISVPKVVPTEKQQSIIAQILDHHKVHEHTVAFVHGPPGTGKSMLGLLLTDTLNGVYANCLKPWEPGNSLNDLYYEVSPTEEKPLILAFDEIDGALVTIHSGIAPHKSLPIPVSNKAGWNKFLDEIQRGMFPHLILLLTSNRAPEFIRSLDPSYIREKRVDLICELL